IFFFSSRRRHTRFSRDWSSDVCSSDLTALNWLGEIVTDRDEKIRCFEEALDADPNNDFAEERLADLLKPTKPKPSIPPPPDTLRSEERRVGKECRSWRWPQP